MRLWRQAAIFALLVTLAAPWIAGAAPDPQDHATAERPAPSVSVTLNHLWSYLTSLWEALPTADAGCRADPLGCPTTPTTDAGPLADPLG